MPYLITIADVMATRLRSYQGEQNPKRCPMARAFTQSKYCHKAGRFPCYFHIRTGGNYECCGNLMDEKAFQHQEKRVALNLASRSSFTISHGYIHNHFLRMCLCFRVLKSFWAGYHDCLPSCVWSILAWILLCIQESGQ